MAGDWIKMELTLPDKPEVHYIANTLNLDPDAVIGKLLRVWAWFDQHTEDGNAHGVTFALVDRLVCVAGFGEAMQFAGWLEQKDALLCMPNFDKHNSESAKKRAQSASRQKRYRNAHSNANVTHEALPREEKRREEVNPKPNTATPPGFAEFWSAYPKKVGKGDAEKAWKKLKPDLDAVTKSLSILCQSEQWRKDGGQFIPFPATWLNRKGWEDEVETKPEYRPAERMCGKCKANPVTVNTYGGVCQGCYSGILDGRLAA